MEPMNPGNIVLSFQFHSDDMEMVMASDGKVTAFSGVAKNSFFTLQDSPIDRVKDLLIRAVNNRTRERNYFQLYSMLLDNKISDDEFDKTIENNEDDYVVSQDCEADLNDIRLALFLVQEIKDIKDVDDMAALFSFSYGSIRKSLNC